MVSDQSETFCGNLWRIFKRLSDEMAEGRKNKGKQGGGVSNTQPLTEMVLDAQDVETERAGAFVHPYPSPSYQYYNHMIPPMVPSRPIYPQITNQNQDGGLHDLISEMNNRLKTIESSFSKLKLMEKDVAYLKSKVTEIHENNKSIGERIGDVEKFCQTFSDLADDNIDAKRKFQEEISSLKAENTSLKQEINHLKTQNDDLHDMCLQNQCRSMENNLIFFAIDEVRPVNEGAGVVEKENVERSLRHFNQEQLKENPAVNADIDTENIHFDRVHRLGNPATASRNQRPRPIVAKFERFCEREKVRKAGNTLNKAQRSFKVHELFLREIENKRKSLYPVARRHIDRGDKVALVRDRLYINNRLYDPQNYDIGITREQLKNRQHDLRQPSLRGPQRQTTSYTGAGTVRLNRPSFQTPNRFSVLRSDSEETPSQKRKVRSPLDMETTSKRNEPWGTTGPSGWDNDTESWVQPDSHTKVQTDNVEHNKANSDSQALEPGPPDVNNSHCDTEPVLSNN